MGVFIYTILLFINVTLVIATATYIKGFTVSLSWLSFSCLRGTFLSQTPPFADCAALPGLGLHHSSILLGKPAASKTPFWSEKGMWGKQRCTSRESQPGAVKILAVISSPSLSWYVKHYLPLKNLLLGCQMQAPVWFAIIIASLLFKNGFRMYGFVIVW